jgi:hypothetical protein
MLRFNYNTSSEVVQFHGYYGTFKFRVRNTRKLHPCLRYVPKYKTILLGKWSMLNIL